MTNPIPAGIAHSTFYVRERKDFAIEQEKYRHDQALYSIGEPAMFALLWRLEDHQKGYVARCPMCYTGINAKAAEAFNQPIKNKCPMCYGTTFEGGLRAKIVRPTIFTDTDDQENPGSRGETFPQTVTVETTSDFRFRSGDYVFRADGSRYQLSSPARTQLRTGYGHPSQINDSISYAPTQASMEDPGTVAWIIPPSTEELRDILTSISRYPVSPLDLVNAPLIPEGWTD